MGAFDDAGDVGHDEGAVVAVADDAEIGLQRREGVIRDFRLGGGNGGEQGGLPRIREADEADIRQQFQFKDEPALDALLARLGIARRLVGRRLEVVVAQAAAAAAAEDVFLAGFNEFSDNLFRLGILDRHADRHIQVDVGAVLALPQGKTAGAAVLRPDHLPEFQVDQRPELRIGAEDDVSAAAAVPTVRSAFRHVFRPVQVRRSGAPVPGRTEDFYVVDEIAVCHNALFLHKGSDFTVCTAQI